MRSCIADCAVCFLPASQQPSIFSWRGPAAGVGLVAAVFLEGQLHPRLEAPVSAPGEPAAVSSTATRPVFQSWAAPSLEEPSSLRAPDLRSSPGPDHGGALPGSCFSGCCLGVLVSPNVEKSPLSNAVLPPTSQPRLDRRPVTSSRVSSSPRRLPSPQICPESPLLPPPPPPRRPPLPPPTPCSRRSPRCPVRPAPAVSRALSLRSPSSSSPGP